MEQYNSFLPLSVPYNRAKLPGTCQGLQSIVLPESINQVAEVRVKFSQHLYCLFLMKNKTRILTDVSLPLGYQVIISKLHAIITITS